MTSPYQFTPLDVSQHDRAAFASHVEELDVYIRERASRDSKHRLAAVYVLTARAEPRQIIGYYTLSNYTIAFTDLPRELRKRMPTYPAVPTTLIGRLAVDARYQKQGHGERVLYDALYRSMLASREVASMAVIVDAKGDIARAFYEHHGFLRFTEHPYRLYLPMKTIATLFTE